MKKTHWKSAFVGTIVTPRLSFEELLRLHYKMTNGIGGRLNRGKKVDQANFSDLLDGAYNDNSTSEEETKLLHNLLKNTRNPYVHMKDIKVNNNGKSDQKRPNFFTQYSKIKDPVIIECDVENETKEAIQLLVTLLPKISGQFGGL